MRFPRAMVLFFLFTFLLSLTGCGSSSSIGGGSSTSTPTQTTSFANEWTWEGGSNSTIVSGYYGVYGTQGVASTGNVAGGRFNAVSWTDSSGNFWLFGGAGLDSMGGLGYLNDLWEYDPPGKKWTWVSGANTLGPNGAPQPGVYGMLGVAAAANVPAGRFASTSWTDNSGNLWLFGGSCETASAYVALNDLWEFTPPSREWTWVSGANTLATNGPSMSGVYGTLGVAAVGNVPGGRSDAASWTDGNGDLWLFGGGGLDSVGMSGNLNDLWEFNPATREWTWVGGSNTVGSKNGGMSGVYGTLGVAATGNVPGGRASAVSWTDSTGNFWLFGGGGFDSTGAEGYLNDLWKFSPGTKEWTWVSGASSLGSVLSGVYGMLGIAAAGNVPGGRYSAVGWTDSSGNLWLFGGQGYDSAGVWGYLNDLWEFNPVTKEWTWVSGANKVGPRTGEGVPGVYGSLGTPAPANVPGGRTASISWTDGSGNLWLFGGFGFDSAGSTQSLNDLWKFQP